METGSPSAQPVYTDQSFACLQPRNTDYRTYKTTLKVQVKCSYYANITIYINYDLWDMTVTYTGRQLG